MACQHAISVRAMRRRRQRKEMRCCCCLRTPKPYYSTMGAGRCTALPGGALAPGRRKSRISPSSVGRGGVPFFVCRSSRSIATSSRRCLRSSARRCDTSSTSSLRTRHARSNSVLRRVSRLFQHAQKRSIACALSAADRGSIVEGLVKVGRTLGSSQCRTPAGVNDSPSQSQATTTIHHRQSSARHSER